MIDIKQKIKQALFSESTKKQLHMFNNGKTTFRQLRNVFNDVLSNGAVTFSKKVPFVQIYITSKDGNFFASTVKKVGKFVPISKTNALSEVDKSSGNCVLETAKNIASALSSIDPILLNRYFADGKNCMKCSLICPPEGLDDQYKKRCFVKYDGVDCFDKKFNVIGQDKKTSFELYKILKSSPLLDYEFTEISPEQLRIMRNYTEEKNILNAALEKLNTLVDGIGWGCTIDYYIHDKACRSIINKALQHNLDISKNGQLVNELIARICGTSTRPTKSDLITFAKREGIDYKSDDYKAFLNDVENDQQSIANEIILPIDNLLYFVISKLANNVACLMAIDPNPATKKQLKKIALELFTIADSIDDCEFNRMQIDQLKQSLNRLMQYVEIAPVEIRMMYGGVPFSITQSIDSIKKIYEIIM